MKDSKEHILETAFILFMQKGFKAVTIEDIVEKTGMSKGAFYHYFTSKKDLFSEVVNDYILKIMNIDYQHLLPLHSHQISLARTQMSYDSGTFEWPAPMRISDQAIQCPLLSYADRVCSSPGLRNDRSFRH